MIKKPTAHISRIRPGFAVLICQNIVAVPGFLDIIRNGHCWIRPGHHRLESGSAARKLREIPSRGNLPGEAHRPHRGPVGTKRVPLVHTPQRRPGDHPPRQTSAVCPRPAPYYLNNCRNSRSDLSCSIRGLAGQRCPGRPSRPGHGRGCLNSVSISLSL